MRSYASINNYFCVRTGNALQFGLYQRKRVTAHGIILFNEMFLDWMAYKIVGVPICVLLCIQLYIYIDVLSFYWSCS